VRERRCHVFIVRRKEVLLEVLEIFDENGLGQVTEVQLETRARVGALLGRVADEGADLLAQLLADGQAESGAVEVGPRLVALLLFEHEVQLVGWDSCSSVPHFDTELILFFVWFWP
jgi:hypothetical protein